MNLLVYIYYIYIFLERFIVALVMRYDTNGVKWTHRSKEKEQWWIQGRGLGARSPLFTFRPNKWGLKGSLPPLSQGLDDRRLAPHPLHFPLAEGLDLPLKSKGSRSSALNKATESFLRLKQLNSLFGKKIPYHFWNFHNIISVYCFKLITVSKWDNFLTLCFSQQQNKG